MNIAIVDDEPVFLKQLHNRLREMKLPDCEIHEFTSGRDLLSFYVKGMYEVIILDVEMPDLTGLQTAERIRQIEGSSEAPPRPSSQSRSSRAQPPLPQGHSSRTRSRRTPL